MGHTGRASSSTSSESDSGSDRRKEKVHKSKQKHKHSKKKEKKHRHKDHGKDKDVVKAAKEFLKHQLAPGSTPSTHESRTLRQSDKEPGKTIPEGQRISDEDYFKKSNEFIAWLHESHQILFNGICIVPFSGMSVVPCFAWLKKYVYASSCCICDLQS
mmetsp:Transcript_38817/g.115415  ORF Transcript_38817/g.115415 Transcript_38817/m.115415 type:complete len:158 (+) Transcript_38817:261-734(+)